MEEVGVAHVLGGEGADLEVVDLEAAVVGAALDGDVWETYLGEAAWKVSTCTRTEP